MSLLHPEGYHGRRRRPPFFEGWYVKLVDASAEQRWAVIAGILLSDDPDERHAFVQVLDGSSGNASYHRYPPEAFEAARTAFDVRVGPNRFQRGGIVLELDGDRTVRGEVRFGALQPWPVTPLTPGIMGPYAWVPRMECNHAVVSFDHGLDGTLELDGVPTDFGGGRGYLEKDWGAAFPAAYVWMQSNHFDTSRTSFMGSIAVVPWLTGAFPGVVAGLWRDGHLHRFATWTRARTTHLEIDDDHVHWTIEDREASLQLRATRATGGLLHAPARQRMSDRVGETMGAEIAVVLRHRGDAVFEGTGQAAGLEIHGDLERLLALQTGARAET